MDCGGLGGGICFWALRIQDKIRNMSWEVGRGGPVASLQEFSIAVTCGKVDGRDVTTVLGRRAKADPEHSVEGALDWKTCGQRDKSGKDC